MPAAASAAWAAVISGSDGVPAKTRSWRLTMAGPRTTATAVASPAEASALVRALLAGEARDHPSRGQRLVGDLRRPVRPHPAHEAGLVLPEIVRAGEDAAVLHPDDLLMHEGARLFPAGLEHRLAARGVPAVPGGVLGDRLGHGRSDEAVVELGALRAVVPGDAVARGPILVAGRMVRAVVVDEVRRIGREQRRPLAVHQPAHVGRAGAVAAEQPVVAEDPEIARPRRRVARRLRHHDRRDARPLRRLAAADVEGEQLVELGVGEAGERQVEVVGRQRLQLGGEQRLVPCSELGQLVVADAVRLPLFLGQMVEHDHRRLGQAELGGGEDAAVAGDHLAVASDQHRIGPAELRHRRGDLRDLVRPVGLRVPGIGLQALERPMLDALRSEAQGHGSAPWGRGTWIPGGGFRHWIPLGPVDSFRGPAEATPGRGEVFVLLAISGAPVDSGCRVASQKNAAVASELARSGIR